MEVVRQKSLEAGAFAAVLSDHWAKGTSLSHPDALPAAIQLLPGSRPTSYLPGGDSKPYYHNPNPNANPETPTGGEGAVDLANAVVAASEAGPVDFKFLYPPETSIKEKLHAIVTEMYGVSQQPEERAGKGLLCPVL